MLSVQAGIDQSVMACICMLCCTVSGVCVARETIAVRSGETSKNNVPFISRLLESTTNWQIKDLLNGMIYRSELLLLCVYLHDRMNSFTLMHIFSSFVDDTGLTDWLFLK